MTCLWLAGKGPQDERINELVAFNDALDGVLAASIGTLTEALVQGHDLFIGMLGHDLRNPLNAITVSAATLQRDQALSPIQRTFVRHIATSGERMDRLVGDLLEYARIRLGPGLPLNVLRCDLAAITRRIVDELEIAYSGRSIRVGVDGDTSGQWDPERIAQVASNLVGNALEHGDRNTAVSVDVSGVDGGVRMRVHNHGPSIPSDVQQSLVEPMRNAATLWHHRSRSLGLGLFIVRAIVSAHGGRIELVSRDAEGTSFEVWLPRLAGEERDQPKGRRTLQ